MNTATLVAAPQRQLSDLPHPRGLPWLGNLHQLDTTRLHLVLEQWQRELGPMFTLSVGRRKVLVCSDTELIQAMLRERPHTYRRMHAIQSVLKEMGCNGVFSVEGEDWLPQRKLVMQALAAPHMREFFAPLQAITERLLRRWRGVAARGEVVDMREELIRYTVDVTATLAFGEDPNTLEESGDIIQQHLALIFPMVMSRINAPLPYWRWFKLPQDRRLDRALTAVHAHVRGLIDRNRARMQAAPQAQPANLIQALLAARDAPDSTMTDDDVQANVLTLLLAGEDTTAISLAWAMPYLCADAALQARLQAQADEVLGESATCPTLEQLRRLDAFEAVVTESLRLRPTVPALLLEPMVDVQLGGVAVPAGTPLWLLTRPDMLDPRHFDDPLHFRPERWTQRATTAAGCPVAHGTGAHNPRAHLQFGAGPRVCPGRHLAGVEMRMVLSMLMRHFHVELACAPHELQEVLAFTMMPERMPVRLHPRAMR